jgi:hypothetical protein
MSAAPNLHLVEASATHDAIVEFLYHEGAVRDAKARIGRTLRARRVALHLSLEGVAHLLHGSSGTASDLAKVERGVAPRGLALARKVDELLTKLEAGV